MSEKYHIIAADGGLKWAPLDLSNVLHLTGVPTQCLVGNLKIYGTGGIDAPEGMLRIIGNIADPYYHTTLTQHYVGHQALCIEHKAWGEVTPGQLPWGYFSSKLWMWQEGVSMGGLVPPVYPHEIMLDLVSTTQGFRLPQMTTLQRVAMQLSAGHEGLSVYDLDLHQPQCWTGTVWAASTGPVGATGPASTVPGPIGPASTVPGPIGPAGIITGTNAILQNITEGTSSVTTVGATTLDTIAGDIIYLTLGGNHSITLPSSPGSVSKTFTLYCYCQGFTPIWASSPVLVWATSDGAPPILNIVTGKTNEFVFQWELVKSRWIGSKVWSEL